MRVDSDHRVRHLPRPVSVCLLRLRTYGRTDALILAASLGVYALNEFIAKPLLLGCAAGGEAGPSAISAIALLLKNHFNDFLGGVAFLAYVNLLFALVKPGRMITRAAPALALIFCCALFWECAAPLFVPDSVGDPLDLLAYLLGGTLYCLIRCRKPAPANS